MKLNKIFVVGNLTRDPELRYTGEGTPVCDLGLAVNSGYGDHEKVCFVSVTVWGKAAENCVEYLSKGKAVHIEGRLDQENWVTDDGQKRSKHKITAEPFGVQFLSSVKAKDTEPEEETDDNNDLPSDSDDDDIPF